MTAPELHFTGERLVPGQVDRQLLEEHVARYQFALKTLAPLPPGAPVLDLACGAGYGTHMLALAGFRATGVDISPEAIAWAREHFPASSGVAPTYREGDVTALELPAASYAGIVAFEILEHLEDPAGLLDSLGRLLAPGGIALVSTPNPEAHQIAGENEFHHHEYSVPEFTALLAHHFPGWNWDLVGQVKAGLGGSALVTGLRKSYIGLKRAVGLGPLVKKAIAPWDPTQTLADLPHPYHFQAEGLSAAEYLVAILRKPG